MKLEKITSFRKDLLFQGAVQLGWFERDKSLSEKAAAHFIFHGPDYHGVSVDEEPGLQLLDTASLTCDIAQQLTGQRLDDPFVLGIAGYGTGKSHYALTIATLFSQPNSDIAHRILDNLALADPKLGGQVANLVSCLNGQPYLAVPLNGMEDFDLASEISRQILATLKERKIDTKVLENLRPRFNLAKNFAVSFHESIKEAFQQQFGPNYKIEDIVLGLESQDELVFGKINDIYTEKIGSAFPAVGQESLQDFLRVTKETYCGPEKPFAGILLLFDEFGRYLEFAVQKPHIAGPAALQQLFEAVQENGDKVFMIAFIQGELKAYVSRVAPERREEINRYITRFDAVRKIRLSTNLETVIANLLEKKNPSVITEHLTALDTPLEQIQSSMKDWFPEIRNHALWLETQKFQKVVGNGCWPLHPLSTWVLYKLTTIGKSLQQRSALSLLADVFEMHKNMEFELGKTIRPIGLLTEGLIDEFTTSENFGVQGAITYAYQNVMQKYQHQLITEEKLILKAIVLQQKIGIKVKDKDDYIQAISMFCGVSSAEVTKGVISLEKEYGVLEWNGLLCQYEIIGDAIPRKSFLARLTSKADEINSYKRTQIFTTNCKQWLDKEEYHTDFGANEQIYTKEWNYEIHFTNVYLLENQIEFALLTWLEAKDVDIYKGQLIYCYVGPESNLSVLRDQVQKMIKNQLAKIDQDINIGSPLAVIFLYDSEGKFGQKLAEYWIIEHGFSEEDKNRFSNFIMDKKTTILQELVLQFSEMEKERIVEVATEAKLSQGRIKQILEQLFNVIYPNRIPFPFDGFSTSRGNAAKDNQAFTKELFLGNLDREWLQARNQQQRNRGYSVLDNCWGIFDADGSVRLLPTNNRVREALKVLDMTLQVEAGEKDSSDVNLGKVVRSWIAPPFGCNLAIAGLLLAVYIGRRKEELDLCVDGNVVGLEKWLADAMSKNYFDLSKLDHTSISKVSKEKINEWEVFLEEWQLEPTYYGQKKFREKAVDLQKRLSIPQKLKYKYQHIYDKSNEALKRCNSYDHKLNDATEKIEIGESKNNANLLSWGAAILAAEYQIMNSNKQCWTEKQFEEIEQHYAAARILVKKVFPKWLNSQRITNIEQLGKFRHNMLKKVGRNLEKLGFEEEKKLLETHVEDVEKNVRLLAEIKESTINVKKLTENNVTNKIPMSKLQEWQEEASNLQDNLSAARERTSIAKHEIYEATTNLAQFGKLCRDQIQQHRKKAGDIYSHRSISTLADLTAWKTEVHELISVFAGQEKDIDDFKQVIRQLDFVEKHFGLLSEDTLTQLELEQMLNRCREELSFTFSDDQPPLDSEIIYSDIMSNVQQRRSKLAEDWMNRMLPKTSEIQTADANIIIETKKQFEKMPAVLSEEQRNSIILAIQACEKRLDEMEVEGLLAKFEAFSESNKSTFLKKLIAYLEQHFPSAKFKLPFNG